MANLSDPKLILAQAAEAAEAAAAILPKLESEYDSMEAALRAKQQEITEVRALAERFKPMPNVSSVHSGIAPLQVASGTKSAVADMEAALIAIGPASTVQLIDWMKEHTGRVWAKSTVWNNLKSGKDGGRYINEDNRWRMAGADDMFGKAA